MFSYHMPTQILCGRDCVLNFRERLCGLGSRALIVTGKSSAQNGALADISDALSANGQTYAVFDRVTPNPTVPCVREGIALLKAEGCNFVIGLGGGSPMDAAKAIALLSVEERSDADIFKGNFRGEALPMAHIPTTAGTGSEVTQYAILTNDPKQTKTSISSPALFPKFAFLDGKYMADLPRNITVNTALDAFSHAAESLLSTASAPMSELLAKECLRGLYPLLKGGLASPDLAVRDALLYDSALAGMAIAQTGTTAVHGMGYELTYFCGIDHGRANGLLLGEALRLSKRKGVPAADTIEDACGAGTEEICGVLDFLLGKRERIERARLEAFAAHAAGNKNIKKSSYLPTPEEIREIFLRSFLLMD